MTELHAELALRVDEWRRDGYAHDRYPAIAEVLTYAIEGETTETLRFLRAAQLRALETYWYLRLIEGTPHIAELYRRLFASASDRMAALGLDTPALKDVAVDAGYDGLIGRIRTDDAFAKTHRLDALRGHWPSTTRVTSWPWPWALERPSSSARSSRPSSPWPWSIQMPTRRSSRMRSSSRRG